MITLDTKLTLDRETIESPNLANRFTEVDLARLGGFVYDGYMRDKASRSKWETRMDAAMDLAMQVQKMKNFPWPNCSNVDFPLLTIAILQFHARAYPAIITGPELVKYKVIGSDPEGIQKNRAERVGMHMSWQLTEQDRDWESQHDRLLINLPVIGSNFKKSYRGDADYNESDLVMSRDLVLDYYASCVETCPRKTHVFPLFRNEIYERVKLKTFKDILEDAWYKQPTAIPTTTQGLHADNRAGTTQPQPDEITPFQFLEQHVSFDFDQDGYAEPCVITIETTSKTVVRIVMRFEQEADIIRNSDQDVVRIKALEYFTGYIFLPSPDGSIYGLGFGILLGPLNESTNSLINQLVDAGTMSNAAGGFLGRGAKIRGGVYSFSPFGWQRVDSTGDDLKKSIFPLPVREPSNVLFQLLSLLIQYTNRISGSTDIMVGESVGQNTPADTARQMQAEGMKIYNAIFKRIWNSMKEEFRKLYILNAYYMPDSMSFGVDGVTISRNDYLGDPTRIAPVADPNTTTQADRIAQAQLLKQTAMSTAGYDLEEVERIYLKALNIPNIDIIYPGPSKVPPGKDLKIQLKEMDLQKAQMQLQGAQQQHAMDLMAEHELNVAKINEMEAHAASMMAGIQGEQAAAQLEVFRAMVEMTKSRNDVLMQRIQHQTKMIEHSMKQVEHAGKLVENEGRLIEHETKKTELKNAKREATN